MTHRALEEPPLTPLAVGRNCSSLKYSLSKFKCEASGEVGGRDLLATLQACRTFSQVGLLKFKKTILAVVRTNV